MLVAADKQGNRLYAESSGKRYTDCYCPICGEPVETEYTRIVGFYTPTKTYSKERKAEFKLREWLPLDEEGAFA